MNLSTCRKWFGKTMLAAAAFVFGSAFAFAQTKTVSGTVLDNFGDPVIGANVVIVGTQEGTITDIDGNFTLNNVKNDAKLKITYIGYETQTVSVAGKSNISVTLKEDNTMLEDVVVVGYGTMRKKDLTGSVATISADAITAIPVANPTEAIAGKMSGVQVTTTEGSPDADVKIRVRGGGSITQSNDPLYIVDGFPVESISDIPASDIEDISILKDASSTAIYGSRGANGVILVTTKSGKEGKVNVSYNAYYTFKKIAKKLDVLSSGDYARWQYELAMLRGKSSQYTDFFGSYADVAQYDNVATNDWQDQVFGRIGHTFNHNLSVTGGSETIKYSFSYAHMDDKAIMMGSSFRRDNLSLKMQHNIGKKIKLDYQIRWAKTNIDGQGANEQSSSYNTDKRLRYAIQFVPFPVNGITGAGTDAEEDDATGGNFYHPVTAITDNDQQRQRNQLNLSGSFQWEIFKNFKFKTEVGYDTYNQDTDRFWGVSTYYVQQLSDGYADMPAIQFTRYDRNKIRNTNTVNYDFKGVFGKNSKHHLDALLGEEYVLMKSKTMTSENHGYPTWFSSDQAWKLTSQGHAYSTSNFYDPDDILSSYFGRFNYNYAGKYYVSATFRADGSSKFADGERWGFFPSASIAWRVSDEAIFQSAKGWLDDLKLRFSYGAAGNNNIPSGVSATQEYLATTTSWINGYNTYWAPSKTMSNAKLTWETTYTRNLGLDYSFFNSRINGTIEGYWNNTKDLLIQFPVAGTGYDYQYRNMGETSNKGFEFSINGVAVQKKNYDLTIGFNMSINKNKVESLGLLQSIDNINTGWASSEIDRDFIIAVGEPIGQIYGYKADGRYEVSDFDIAASQAAGKWVLNEGVADCSNVIGTSVRPGSLKLKDNDGNGTITADDRQVIGDTNPTLIGGLNLNARIWWFDISANFNFSVGNDVYNANAIEYTMTSKYKYRNLIDDMASGKRWTNIDANGNFLDWNSADALAALNTSTTTYSPYTEKYVLTSNYVEDGSFLRLSTLTVGYSLPKKLLTKLRLSNLRVYATGYNIFCITNYSGMDPEVSACRKTNMTPGVDYSAYPKSRQFVVGLNLNF